MIVWSGLGFVVAIIGFSSLLLIQLLAGYITGDEQYFSNNNFMILPRMVIAAALTYGFNHLLSRQQAQALIDKKSGRENSIPHKHSLFFIPVKWWAWIFIAVGLSVAAAK